MRPFPLVVLILTFSAAVWSSWTPDDSAALVIDDPPMELDAYLSELDYGPEPVEFITYDLAGWEVEPSQLEEADTGRAFLEPDPGVRRWRGQR